MSSNKPKSSLRDQLTATTDESKIELTEQELRRVGGGWKFLKYDVREAPISSY
jgi:hypothetical protein